MKRTPSPEQLAANRRNASKSTGPKTVQGKAASRMNARKHGLLARQVVVCGYKYSESIRDFKTLCREFYESEAPVGPMEEMLVERIVETVWRLRRVRTAESGEIALSVDGGCWKRENHSPSQRELAWPSSPFTDVLGVRLRRTVDGNRYLLHVLQDVRAAVEKAGELTEATVVNFKGWLRDHPDLMINKLVELRARLVSNPEQLAAEAWRTLHLSEVLKYLDKEIVELRGFMRWRQEREDNEEAASQSAALLPDEEKLEKILRYEAALDRQLFRYMTQLERSQRRRLGEEVPSPMTMRMSGID